MSWLATDSLLKLKVCAGSCGKIFSQGRKPCSTHSPLVSSGVITIL